MPQKGWIRKHLSKQKEQHSKSHRKRTRQKATKSSQAYPYPSVTYHESPSQSEESESPIEALKYCFYDCISSRSLERECPGDEGAGEITPDSMGTDWIRHSARFRLSASPDTSRSDRPSAPRIWRTPPHWEALHSGEPTHRWSKGSGAAAVHYSNDEDFDQIQATSQHPEISYIPQLWSTMAETHTPMYCSCDSNHSEVQTATHHPEEHPTISRTSHSSLSDMDTLGQTLSGLNLSRFSSAPALLASSTFTRVGIDQETRNQSNRHNHFQSLHDAHPMFMGIPDWGEMNIPRVRREREMGYILDFEHLKQQEILYATSPLSSYGFPPSGREEYSPTSLPDQYLQHNDGVPCLKGTEYLAAYNKRWSEINALITSSTSSLSSDTKAKADSLSVPWPSSAPNFTKSSLSTNTYLSTAPQDPATLWKLNTYRFFCFSFGCQVTWNNYSHSGGTFDIRYDGNPAYRMDVWNGLRDQLKLEKVRWHEDKMRAVFGVDARSEDYECVQAVWEVVIDLKERAERELNGCGRVGT